MSLGICRHRLEGFPTTGPIPDSGIFRQVDRPATDPWPHRDRDRQADNSAWIARLESSLRQDGSRSDTKSVETHAALWQVSVKELGKGTAWGPFTKRELDRRFGLGQWRPMRRFWGLAR